MGTYLETERLVLREVTADDVDLLIELDADPDVVFYITGGLPTPREEIDKIVLPRWLRYYRESPGFGFWAAEERSTGEFLGWFHFRPDEDHAEDEPELGYRLRRSASGKGFATEGSRALIDKGFADHGVRRVLASCIVVHAASRRVLEKAGLRQVRQFVADWPYRIPGDEHGDVEYALTREQWAADRTGEAHRAVTQLT